MRTIRLYGFLGREFGREFTLDVRTPAQAVRALCAMLPGFEQALRDGNPFGYHLRVGREFRGEEGAVQPCGRREVIKLIPATAGSSAAARIIVGVVLIVVGAYFGQGWMVQIGVSLVLGGIAQMLAPRPKSSEQATQRSYLFGGSVNTVGQGVGVPIGYGRMMVESHVIGAAVYSEEFPLVPYTTPVIAPADSTFASGVDYNTADGGSAGDGDAGFDSSGVSEGGFD